MKLPKVGDVVESKYDPQQLCHIKEWVSAVKSDKEKLLIVRTRTRHHKPGTGHHEFYGGKNRGVSEENRKCEFCGAGWYKPLKFGIDPKHARLERRPWDEKCPAEQLHTSKSTEKRQRFFAVNGPKAGKFLTEEEAGDGYVAYNRSSRWRSKEGPYKVVLLALSTLKR